MVPHRRSETENSTKKYERWVSQYSAGATSMQRDGCNVDLESEQRANVRPYGRLSEEDVNNNEPPVVPWKS